MRDHYARFMSSSRADVRLDQHNVERTLSLLQPKRRPQPGEPAPTIQTSALTSPSSGGAFSSPVSAWSSHRLRTVPL